jgi:hypothetical protein
VSLCSLLTNHHLRDVNHELVIMQLWKSDVGLTGLCSGKALRKICPFQLLDTTHIPWPTAFFSSFEASNSGQVLPTWPTPFWLPLLLLVFWWHWCLNSGPRASQEGVLTAWATLPALCCEGFFERGSHKLVAWGWL